MEKYQSNYLQYSAHLTHGCKSGVLNEQPKSKIQATAMKYYYYE